MGRIVGHVCQVHLHEDDSNGTDLLMHQHLERMKTCWELGFDCLHQPGVLLMKVLFDSLLR